MKSEAVADRSHARRGRESFDLQPRSVRRWASPLLFADHLLMTRLRGLRGQALLDVGCGAMPHRQEVSGVDRYDGIDLVRRIPEVRFEGSVTEMPQVPTADYDHVLCTEVLEHVDRPDLALAEMARVLKPGGTLLLTVPFLSRLHEEPHDYYRYTRHGLRHLLEAAGFEVVEIEPTTSLASFLGHQVCSAAMTATWRIPVLRWVSLATLACTIVVPAWIIDRAILAFTDKFPANYLVVARRRAS